MALRKINYLSTYYGKGNIDFKKLKRKKTLPRLHHFPTSLTENGSSGVPVFYLFIIYYLELQIVFIPI